MSEIQRAPTNEKGQADIHEYSDGSSDEVGITDKALVRKIDLHLLPPLTLLYLLSFLDRSNVGNARLEGLIDDLYISGNQYLTGLTIFFIGYVLFEVPCNIVLKRTSPKLWLPTLAFVWGIVATLLGVVQNYPGFLVSRLFLGATESGLFPGVMFYLSMWYKREERHFRIALFFSAASLAGAFGGILAWGIAHMRGVGGYGGWRWIFIIEGILTVLVGACAFFLISNYPSSPDVKFLTLKEKQLIHNRLRDDSDATRHETFAWTNALKAFRDPKVWLYGLSFHTVALPLYTLSLFLPTIINQLGYTAAQAQLMTIPPYSVAFVLTVSLAFFAERAHARAPFIMGSSFLALCGYIILLATPSSLPGLAYFGTFLAAGGIYPSVALVFAWPANNVSGQTKRAVSNALQNSIGTLGAVLGTQLYRTETAPRFFLGHGFAAGYLATNILIVALLRWVLKRENVKRERGERDRRLQDLAEGEWLGDDDPRWRFQL